MLNKLRRQASYLEAEVNKDEFDNFALTAYHLLEWVEKEPSFLVDGAMRTEMGALKGRLELQACRDAANSCKHRQITRSSQTADTNVDEGFGVGRFGYGGYGIGEEQMELSRQVLGIWEDFFARYVQRN
jgi:hypothetical protein